jgi:predicted nucleic acid-binding Zn finger protein
MWKIEADDRVMGRTMIVPCFPPQHFVKSFPLSADLPNELDALSYLLPTKFRGNTTKGGAMITDAQLELLDSLGAKYDEQRGSEVEVLKSLDFALFDNRKLLESAVEMIGEDGRHSIKQFSSVSCGRKCWKVRGSQDREYTCLSSFCSCPSYLMQSKQASGRVLCKHLLAIKIAGMLGSVEKEEVSDERFVDLLCQETSVSSIVSAKPFRSWRK